MTEREMEDLLWQYPEKFLNEPLKFRRQERSAVGRSDLIFTDRLERLLIVEVKRDKLPREAIGQLHDYFGVAKTQFPNRAVELMVIANIIPPERRIACNQYDIDCREISKKKFHDVAEEVGYVFASESGSSQGETVRSLEPQTPPVMGVDHSRPLWSYGASRTAGDENEFLARCDEEGKAFFSAFFERTKPLSPRKVKTTWDHESGFSLQFYFRRLGFVEMVWGFPARNREGKGGRYGQSLVFPFDFAKKRQVPLGFIDALGEALASAVPLSTGPKRPRICVNNLTPVEAEHILKTICEFAERASSQG